MDYQEFLDLVRNTILDYMPEEYQSKTAEIEGVVKNNGEQRMGLRIKGANQFVAPMIYLESSYERLQMGVPKSEVLKQIADTYVANDQPIWQDKIGVINDFEKVKDWLKLSLVNRENNQERLQNCPVKEIEGTDLVAELRLDVSGLGCGSASVLIKDNLLEMWGQDKETIYEMALKNMVEHMPAKVMDIIDLLDFSERADDPENMACEMGRLYVLTNSERFHGASAMVYPGVLQTLAENCGSNFYILPSSIHEVILLLDDGQLNARDLQSLVIGVNEEEVSPEEVLSNQVYYYDGISQKLSIAIAPETIKENLWGAELFRGENEDMLEDEMER